MVILIELLFQIIEKKGEFTRMENKLQALYGKLANHISGMIPTEWSELYFLGDMGREGKMITAVFYFKERKSGKFIRSFNIFEMYNISEDIFDQLYDELDSMLLEIYQCFKDNDQELWQQITLKLSSDGKLKVDFHYDVITDDVDDDHLRRELLWAYNNFGYLSDSSYLREIVEDYIQGKESKQESKYTSTVNKTPDEPEEVAWFGWDLTKESKKAEEPRAGTSQGWDAIVDHFKKIYPDQPNPKHYRPLISPKFTSFENPLFGTDIYDGGDFWHFVTYGLSDVYDREEEKDEWSGFGLEMTLKLKKTSEMNDPETEENELKNISGVLQDLGQYIFETNEVFLPNQYIYSQQTDGFDYEQKSKLTGFAIAMDEAGTIETPNGKVEFLCIIGLTDKELRSIYEGTHKTEEILKLLGNDLTDFDRDDLI